MTDYDTIRTSEGGEERKFQWMTALKAGLVAGIILRIVPRASPWESLTFFSPVIMGRAIPEVWGMPLSFSIFLHLVVSIIYGLVISIVVVRLRAMTAVVVGGAIGLALYGLNLAIISMWLPALAGSEIPVAITHLVFGLVAAGAYRGLLRRRVISVQ